MLIKIYTKNQPSHQILSFNLGTQVSEALSFSIYETFPPFFELDIN